MANLQNLTYDPQLVGSLVAAIVGWAHRHRTVVVSIVAFGLIVSIEGSRRLSFDADVLTLLPRDSGVIQAFRAFLSRFGSFEQLYVIFTAPEGHAISEYAEEIDAWVDALRGSPEIVRVDAGTVDRTRSFDWLANRQLLVLHDGYLDEALRRLGDTGMPAAIAGRRDLLALPSSDVAQIVRQDPAALFDLLRESLGGGAPGTLMMGMSERGYVTADGRSRLLIARPARPPFDVEFSRALDARLRQLTASTERSAAQARADVDEDPLPAMQVQFAGGHRIAVETEAVVKRESIWNTVGSLIIILPLLYLVFRSLWLVLVGPLPSGLSLLFVLGAIGFTGAKLSAAATGAAAMLFGLGVDGVVLVYVAHRQLLADGRTSEIPAALEGPSTSMLLGMFTTAATFYGLMFVDFPSLEQLGRLLGHSMMICGVLTLIMVPALLPRRPPRRPLPALLMPRLAAWIVNRRRSVLAASLVVTVVFAVAATRMRINPTLDRLRSVTDAAEIETTIGPKFGLPSDVYIVLAEGPELEPLLQSNERLAQRLTTELSGLAFLSPSRLLPSLAAQDSRAAAIRNSRLSPGIVRDSLERARVANGFTPGAFEPFSARLSSLLDTRERITYSGFVEHGLGDLVDRFVVHESGRWSLATYLFPSDAAQATRIQEIVDSTNSSGRLTGMTPVNRELARSFVPQFIKGLSIGTLLVVALVVVAFRSWRLSAYALLPTLIGLTWAAGVLAIAGVELDLFAVFAVVTFVGIGVDYGIHLVHRYHERGDAERATAELAPVILSAAAITLGGYGTLIWSSYPPLRSIGIVSVASTVALAAASVLVLPALLLSGRRPAPAAATPGKAAPAR
jgi:predicted RND superfamily exporter protein